MDHSSGSLSLTTAYLLVHRLHAPVEERYPERVFSEEYRHYRASWEQVVEEHDATDAYPTLAEVHDARGAKVRRHLL